MGKANRRLNKRQHRREQAETHQDGVLLRRELMADFTQGDYAGTINVLAKLVTCGQQTTEDLYRGAFSYFMIGDYTRAEKMVSTVLSLAPESVDARILLARLCLLAERIDDALAIFDYIFEHEGAGLTEDQNEQLDDLLAYYVDNEKERLCCDFPQIAAHYHLVAAADAAPVPEETQESAPLPTGTASVQLPDAADEEAPTEDSPVTQAEKNAADEKESVLSGSASVAEKVRLLNAFAAGHFIAGEYAAAKTLLAAALSLDTGDAATLRNLAVLMKRSGDEARAMAFAAKLPQVDFLLLEFLHSKE